MEQFEAFARLIAEQEGALGDGDLDRFNALVDEGRRCQARVADLGSAASLAGTPELVERAAGLLAAALASDARVQAHLADLRAVAADRIREHGTARRNARQYRTEALSSRGLDLTL